MKQEGNYSKETLNYPEFIFRPVQLTHPSCFAPVPLLHYVIDGVKARSRALFRGAGGYVIEV
jgi:hypothetical protein